MSDFDWSSIGSAIASALGFGSDKSQQQPPPPSGGQGLLGATQPQIPTWDQYNKDRSSFGGILSGMLSHGIGPGLGAAIAPDSEAMQTYNAGLGQGQDVGIKGISIPQQQFTADILAGKRDAKTGAWLGAGPDPLAAQQQPSYVPKLPSTQGPGAPVTGASLLPPQGGAGGGSAPAGPNLLAPPGSQPPPDDSAPPAAMAASFSPSAPPAPPAPSAGGMGHTFWGAPLLPGYTDREQRAFMASDPKGYETALTQYLSAKRGGSYYPDMATGKMTMAPIGIAGVPGAPGDPDYNRNVAALEGTKRWAQVGPANAETAFTQRAMENREKNVAGFNNVLQFGDLGMGGAGAGGGGGPKRTTGGPLSGPPIAGAAPPLTTKPMLPQGAGTTEPAESERGTVIPPVSEQTPIPRDAESLKTAIPEWQKTSAAWTSALNPGYQAEQRLQTIAEAFKKTESGSWATEKGAMAGIFKSLGIKATPEMLGDPAQVQIALHNNAVETLQQLKNFTAGTSTRSTQLEFKMLAENKEHPNLQPAANLDFLSQDIGAIRWQRALALDWRDAQKVGWRNPQDFEAAWGAKKPNSISTFVEGVRKEIGPLKGMDGNDGAAAVSFPTPNEKAINHIKMAPNLTKEFDAIYGPGAAARVLGK